MDETDINAAYRKGFTDGRIAEAKTCEEARRHDSKTPNLQDEELRESLDSILLRHGLGGRHLRNDLMIFMQKRQPIARGTLEQGLVNLWDNSFTKEQFIEEGINLFTAHDATREREIRINERKEFRRLWNNLHMTFGASAGGATGVIVRNDFGEEWDFQLDRDAVNALFAHMNSTTFANPKQQTGKE